MLQTSWLFWALMSAVFAAMTAVLTKLGVANINSDLATFIRTCVILVLVGLIAYATKQFSAIGEISTKGMVFLVLSGLATGASWLCYFRAMSLGQASQVAPIDKLSVVLVAIFSVVLLGEKLSMVNWMGIGLITVGVILVSYKVLKGHYHLSISSLGIARDGCNSESICRVHGLEENSLVSQHFAIRFFGPVPFITFFDPLSESQTLGTD